MNEKEFKKEIKDFEIPKELDKRVKNAVKKAVEMEDRKKNIKNKTKRLLIACSLLFIILIGVLKTSINEPLKANNKLLSLPTVNNKENLLALIEDENISEKYEGVKNDIEATKIKGTNNQVDGVDEIDIIKTDGKYIFSTIRNNDGSSTIRIFDGENPSDIKIIKDINSSNYIVGILLHKEKLIVVSFEGNNTIINVYSYENTNNINLVKEIKLNSVNDTARLIGDELVLVQKAYAYSNEKVEDSIPYMMMDGIKNQEKLENIKYCPGVPANSFISIVKLNLNTLKEIESETILAKFENVYVSKENVYIANYNYESDKSEIYKFSIKDGGTLVSKGSFLGKSLNQFSLDEYNENLRIATTTNLGKENSENHVIILDKNLKEVGKISSLGKGEIIHSVRFIEDRGYVVTFKNTDPLYLIDLKDVNNPKLLGEVKVDGVSKYLHPFDKNTLIGFGEDRDEKSYNGIKLSLFSLENGGSELFNEKINGVYSYTIYNHRGFFFDEENSLLGFDTRKSLGNKIEGNLVVYKVSKENGFKMVINETINEFNEGRIYSSNEVVYLVLGDRIATYNSKNFEKLNESK